MRKSVNFVEIIKGLDFDVIDNFVSTEVRDQYIENCKDGSGMLSGWSQRIMLTEEGKLYLTGPMSSNSMSMDEYEGGEVELFRIPCWIENDFNLDGDIIKNTLTAEEEKEFLECVYRKLDFDEDDIEEYTNINYILSDYYIEVEEIFRDMFEDKWNELLDEYFEMDFDYGIGGNYMEEIDNLVEQMESCMD